MQQLKGNINVMAFADILQWISQGTKSGTLEIKGNRVTKEICFDKGDIIATSSTNPREYLGQFLISYGKITEEGLKEVLDEQEKSEHMLGWILVKENVLSENEMKLFLKLKAEESLYDIFLWDEGEFQFIENKTILKDYIKISLAPTSIILEGVRRVDEWKRIHQVIPDSSFIPQIDVANVIDSLPLSTNVTKLLRAVDGKKSVENISMEFRSSNFVVFKNLFECYQKKYIYFIMPIIKNTTDVLEDIAILIDSKLKERKLLECFLLIENYLEKYPNAEQIIQKLKNTVGEANKIIANGKLKASLAISLDELTSKNLTPEEGFLISRLNSSWDINSTIKITPIDTNKAKIIFAELALKGVITLHD